MVEILTTIFATNIEMMTVKDWYGTLITVISFVLTCLAYFWVFRPANKVRLEAHRHHLLKHDRDEPL
ncbi:cbb3-type cytochrome c oxidase subunit 3 [Methylophaga sp. SB9B]|uniref:cbb3-type cytochrome c oxidase subunit 3 n=1 Tax=Methylophaga sp. SB9B TaxID=2570356 RepID=UPI0010A91EC4|nr:cbb3-type cytochrome c oxidase subunit 3 [Methylophaga sp. SB9B]THK41219.1 cbb3-type cytochrome c oxidase subunit 3 [Methylophaga sp. SB9B]